MNIWTPKIEYLTCGLADREHSRQRAQFRTHARKMNDPFQTPRKAAQLADDLGEALTGKGAGITGIFYKALCHSLGMKAESNPYDYYENISVIADLAEKNYSEAADSLRAVADRGKAFMDKTCDRLLAYAS
jgi:hypothetical protein